MAHCKPRREGAIIARAAKRSGFRMPNVQSTLCFIGFGEAGQAIALGLREAGVQSMSAWDIMFSRREGDKLRQAAQASGVRCASSAADAVRGADMIISAVTAASSVEAAQSVRPHLAGQPFFLDISSVSPGRKQQTAKLLGDAARYVDVAVLAPMHPARHRTPMLLSGPHADAIAPSLAALDMRFEVAGAEIGAAAVCRILLSIAEQSATQIAPAVSGQRPGNYQGTRAMKIAIIGNCQIAGIARCMNAMAARLEIKTVAIRDLTDRAQDARDWLAASDVVFTQTTPAVKAAMEAFPEYRSRALLYPRIYFPAYHPDATYVWSEGKHVRTPMGDYNSLLAICGYLKGLSVGETVALFNRDVFKRAGYFAVWDGAVRSQQREFSEADLKLDGAIARWSSKGCFMHTFSHPKLGVLADIAQSMLAAIGVKARTSDAESYVLDELKEGAVWPVYPEVGAALGINGDYCFTPRQYHGTTGVAILDLPEFVEQSHRAYARLPAASLDAWRRDMAAFTEAVFHE